MICTINRSLIKDLIQTSATMHKVTYPANPTPNPANLCKFSRTKKADKMFLFGTKRSAYNQYTCKSFLINRVEMVKRRQVKQYNSNMSVNCCPLLAINCE